MALAVMVGVPTALGQHLYDLGPIGPTGLQDPHKYMYHPYLVGLAKDGKLAGGTDASGNAFIWTPGGGAASIGTGGYNLVGVDWYVNGTVLAIANKWTTTITRPWAWTGNASGSGTWTQLPVAGAASSSAGYWFATGLGVATDNSDWWVSGYTTNTPISGCSVTYADDHVGYDWLNAPTWPVITLFSDSINGRSFHAHGAYYGVSSTGLFVGAEEYNGSCPLSGSVREGEYWQWQTADSGSTTIPMGPPEAGDGTVISASFKCVGLSVSGDGTIKGGGDQNDGTWGAIWWDGSGYVHQVPVMSSGGYPTDWMEIRSLNKDGAVMAGHYYHTDLGDAWYEAFIYFPKGNTVEGLSDYLAAYGLDTTGWVFNDVTGMSYDGTVLAGYGTNSGTMHGWVAQLLTINSVVVSNASCAWANNGSITVTASGAVPVGISIDGGATWTTSSSSPFTHTFSGLANGNYPIQVEDNYYNTANSEPVSYSANPVVLGPVAVSAVSLVNVLCIGANNGSIQVTASGGSTPIQFSDDNGATWHAAAAASPSTWTFTGLAPNNYSIKIKDANGCTASYSSNPVAITQPGTAVTISAVSSTNASCNGINNGSITVTASGGTGALQFSPNGGTNWNLGTSPYTFSGLAAGQYSLAVEDANGCTASYSGNPVTITQPATLTASAAPDTTIGLGASYSLNGSASGGTTPYSYAWSPLYCLNNANIANPTATPLTTVTYRLTVTDALGCTASATVAITVIPRPPLSVTLSGTNVVISWPASYTGFTLWQNSNLKTSNWVSVTNAVNVVNGTNHVTVRISGTDFFRAKYGP